jgi:prepilin-type N-terminal cleavage/methylation domain-containing protein
MTRSTPRRGFTLLELLLVMTVLSITLSFAGVLVLAAMRVDQMSAETMHRLTRSTQLADIFRDDVANSVSAPDSLGDYRRGPTCLILQQPGDRSAVYQFKDGMIERIARTSDGETRRPIALGPMEATVEFDGDGAIIILRITERHRGMPGLRTEIKATLGGDMK